MDKLALLSLLILAIATAAITGAMLQLLIELILR